MKQHQPYTLVTGASGLLGHELLLQLLDQGVRVKAVFHRTPITLSHPLLTVVSCDLLDVVAVEEMMTDVAEVYHCAGLISYSAKSRAALYKINVEATANVVNACLMAGVRKMVHVSSIASLGKFVPGKLIDEETQWTDDARNSAYGYSKYLGEMEVWRGVAEGLDAVIVNPSIILGAGNWHQGSTAIFKNVYDGFKWYTEGVNGFVDVKDVASAMRLLMSSTITAERFILNADNLSYRDVFFAIADAFNKPRPSRKVTPTLASFVWRIESLKSIFTQREPLVTKETAITALAEVRFNNQKLKNFLPGFEYSNFNTTIADICNRLQQMVNTS